MTPGRILRTFVWGVAFSGATAFAQPKSDWPVNVITESKIPKGVGKIVEALRKSKKHILVRNRQGEKWIAYEPYSDSHKHISGNTFVLVAEGARKVLYALEVDGEGKIQAHSVSEFMPVRTRVAEATPILSLLERIDEKDRTVSRSTGEGSNVEEWVQNRFPGRNLVESEDYNTYYGGALKKSVRFWDNGRVEISQPSEGNIPERIAEAKPSEWREERSNLEELKKNLESLKKYSEQRWEVETEAHALAIRRKPNGRLSSLFQSERWKRSIPFKRLKSNLTRKGKRSVH